MGLGKDEEELLKLLESVHPKHPFNRNTDLMFIRILREEFPKLDFMRIA